MTMIDSATCGSSNIMRTDSESELGFSEPRFFPRAPGENRLDRQIQGCPFVYQKRTSSQEVSQPPFLGRHDVALGKDAEGEQVSDPARIVPSSVYFIPL